MTTAGETKKYHLPFSESPEDEFQMPDGEWHMTLRAITYDAWLLWKHALPEDPMLWSRLTEEVVDTVTLLAKRIHNLHQCFADYRRLVDTPFTVSRWWDPTDDTGEWDQGGRVLLKVNGYTARDVEQEVPVRFKGQLILQPRSENWIEISLPLASMPHRVADGTP